MKRALIRILVWIFFFGGMIAGFVSFGLVSAPLIETAYALYGFTLRGFITIVLDIILGTIVATAVIFMIWIIGYIIEQKFLITH